MIAYQVDEGVCLGLAPAGGATLVLVYRKGVPTDGT